MKLEFIWWYSITDVHSLRQTKGISSIFVSYQHHADPGNAVQTQGTKKRMNHDHVAYSPNYTLALVDSLTLCKEDSDKISWWRQHYHFTIKFERKEVLRINTQLCAE